MLFEATGSGPVISGFLSFFFNPLTLFLSPFPFTASPSFFCKSCKQLCFLSGWYRMRGEGKKRLYSDLQKKRKKLRVPSQIYLATPLCTIMQRRETENMWPQKGKK